MNDACLIQLACGEQIPMLQLTLRRHAEYCARYKFDYRPIVHAQTTQECFSHLWLQHVGAALADGYKFVVFLDADAWINADVDLREACPKDGFAAVWHCMEAWPDERCYDHYNIGVFYIGAGKLARKNFAYWSEQDFTGHPWHHQHTFNQMALKADYLVNRLPYRWNSDLWHTEEVAYVRALHGYKVVAQRYEAMKAILCPAPEETLSIDDAFVRGWELQLKGKESQKEAGELLKGVLDLKPDHEDALRQYGIWLCENGRQEEAERYLDDALAYDPAYAATWTALGAVYSKQGRDDESVYALNRALMLAPNQPSARYNRATPMLRSGQWHQGWQDYQYGQVCGLRARRFQTVEWDGWSVIEGKTLLVWSEQGFGDTLMALQLLALVRERFKPGKIILEVSRELRALVKDGFALADEVIPTPSDLHQMREFDAHCSLMSLPAVLGLTPEDLPAATNYLRVECGERSDNLRIGVCWRGRPEHENDRQRSMTQEDFAPVFGIEDAEIYPLMPEEGNLNNWHETARLVATLDVVVTVDTAVAHLAGAMGKPVCLLLAKIPDFRWMLDRTDTPWYPSVSLFRQSVAGDWAPVMAQVAERLGTWHPTAP